MNSKVTYFIKNFSYTLTANLFSLVASMLVVIIVPKLIGVQEYGYWQLYLFYSSYVGLLHFGWNDGVYLRYGGIKYKDIDKQLFFTQFYMLVILQLIISVCIAIFALLFFANGNKTLIVYLTAICSFIVNIRQMPLFVLQGTNRIKDFAKITILGMFIYLSLLIVFLAIGIRDFKFFIIADLIGKLISLGYSLYLCKDFIFCRMSTFYFSFREALDNINVGIKLMIANLASMFIVGTVRFGIERTWDVATFGKVSLTLSLSKLIMVFINALGIILFPVLRRTESTKLPSIYINMRDILMVILLGILVLYYPLKVVLTAWLPEYSSSLIYLALLFPMCIYEGKVALLINTYFKTLRKEKMMLRINIVSLLLSVLVTFITTFLLHQLDLAVLSIVILLAFRGILAESCLSKVLGISVYKDMLLETTIIFSFMLISWFINSWYSFLMYSMVYMFYLIIKRRNIMSSIKNTKKILIKT